MTLPEKGLKKKGLIVGKMSAFDERYWNYSVSYTLETPKGCSPYMATLSESQKNTPKW